MDFKFGPLGPPSKPVVGLVVNSTAFKVAILDVDAQIPWTDELYSLRSQKSFARFWEDRFWDDRLCGEGFAAIAIADGADPELAIWLKDYLAPEPVSDIPRAELQPFLEVAADYDVPRQFLSAHAVAHSAASRLRP